MDYPMLPASSRAHMCFVLRRSAERRVAFCSVRGPGELELGFPNEYRGGTVQYSTWGW